MSILKDLASLAALALFCAAVVIVGDGVATAQAGRGIVHLASDAR